MKKIIFIFSILSCLTYNLFGQFKSDDIEYSLSGFFGSYTEPSNNSYNIYNPTDNSYYYMTLNLSGEYYIINALSIGLEASLNAIEDNKPSQSLIPFISFSYLLPNTKVALFLKTGYGITNGYALQGINYIYGLNSSSNPKLLNFGTGTKILLSNSFALKIELNYRKYYWSKEYSSYNYTQKTFIKSNSDYDFSTFGVLIGFSAFL